MYVVSHLSFPPPVLIGKLRINNLIFHLLGRRRVYVSEDELILKCFIAFYSPTTMTAYVYDTHTLCTISMKIKEKYISSNFSFHFIHIQECCSNNSFLKCYFYRNRKRCYLVSYVERDMKLVF